MSIEFQEVAVTSEEEAKAVRRLHEFIGRSLSTLAADTEFTWSGMLPGAEGGFKAGCSFKDGVFILTMTEYNGIVRQWQVQRIEGLKEARYTILEKKSDDTAADDAWKDVSEDRHSLESVRYITRECQTQRFGKDSVSFFQ